MDALSHAIETFVGIGANPITDSLALQAIDMISNHLRAATYSGNDLEAGTMPEKLFIDIVRHENHQPFGQRRFLDKFLTCPRGAAIVGDDLAAFAEQFNHLAMGQMSDDDPRSNLELHQINRLRK
jgi:hypothetical protein